MTEETMTARTEASARTAAAPAAALIVLASLGVPLAKSQDMARHMDEGERLYAASCAACHGAQGAGVPGVFPPLVGNGVVGKADPTRHITIILKGHEGEGRVGGITYTAPMPPFAAQLDDRQIAAIVNYERTAWGNHAPTVTPQTVAEVRSSIGDSRP
jgi:mono/diheme cytochrome c family protein